jgi:hypothetical protein
MPGSNALKFIRLTSANPKRTIMREGFPTSLRAQAFRACALIAQSVLTRFPGRWRRTSHEEKPSLGTFTSYKLFLFCVVSGT